MNYISKPLFLILSNFLLIGSDLELPIGLTEDEKQRKSEIYSMGRDTDPPSLPIRNISEFEPMSGVLIRYPFGIPIDLIEEMAISSIKSIGIPNGYRIKTPDIGSNSEILRIGSDGGSVSLPIEYISLFLCFSSSVKPIGSSKSEPIKRKFDKIKNSGLEI